MVMDKSDKEKSKIEAEKAQENSKEDSQKEEDIDNKLKDTEDKLLRSIAELENQRRRFEKEKQEAIEFGGFNFALESLAILDNIDRAIDSFEQDSKIKKNKDFDNAISGIKILKEDLTSIFKKNGIESIKCMNEKFDPNFHQAMLEIQDSTKDAGTVVQEIQKGYMMKNRLLRPSLVGVTKKAGENEESNEKNVKNTEEKEGKK